MKFPKGITIIPVVFILAAVTPLYSSMDVQYAVRMANNAIGKFPGDYTLTDQAGKMFRLSELKGKPLIVSFVYTSCSHTCSNITATIRDSIRKNNPGGKFNVLTIGFDIEHDTPERMRDFGRIFTKDFRRWIFATGDRATIERMAKDLGFYYKKNPSGDFDHLSMVTIINPDGMIYRQVYGDVLSPDDILKPLYQSIDNKDAGFKKKSDANPKNFFELIKYICLTYDERTGTYRVDYTFLMSLVLMLVIQSSIVFALIYIFKAKNPKKIFPSDGK